MKKLKSKLITLACAAILAGPAMADGAGATRNLFTNLERSKVDVTKLLASLHTNLDIATVMPTLVRGLYAVQERNGGKPVLFTNEEGTVFGGSDVIYVVPTDGSPIRPMNESEIAGFRAEVMANIRYDKLLKSTFGNGGGRRLIMKSAINCPACKSFEEALLKTEKTKQEKGESLNTTFYVIPASLDALEPNGWNSWKIVSHLWCAENNAKVWKNYWAQREIPTSDIAHCAFAPREAARTEEALTQILVAISGSKSAYFPEIFKEDGTILNHHKAKDADYGPSGMPSSLESREGQDAHEGFHWLTAGTEETSFSSRPIGKPDKNAAAKGTKITISPGNILKGLFK